MKVAIAYDCLYPHTIGGAERWLRDLAVHLARRHQVTYLTRRQWTGAAPTSVPGGVEVVAVSGSDPLYTSSGRRRISPPIRFGIGLWLHLTRHPRRYDVIHVVSFPFFSMLAASLAHAMGGPPLVVDWLEVWSRDYWREYLGPVAGEVGAMIQARCIRATDHAVVHSRLHRKRLIDAGCRREPISVVGLHDGIADSSAPLSPREPLAVFLGRHIPEKRVTAIPAAIALARREIPGLRAILFGAGPESARLAEEVTRLRLDDVVRCPGFVPWEQVEKTLAQAMCLILPSRREGYGLAIVEAAAHGAASIVTRAPESAATELIEEGENGFIVESAEPEELAAGLSAAYSAGPMLAERTGAWFRRNKQRLSIDGGVAAIERLYEAAARSQP